MRYEYQCQQCGWSGEIECLVDERDNQVCPECGTKLKRLLSKPYFRIPRSFRNSVSDEDIFMPIWQPVRYGVSKRELMKEYDKAIEELRKPPDWLKRMREEESKGLEAVMVKGTSEDNPNEPRDKEKPKRENILE